MLGSRKTKKAEKKVKKWQEDLEREVISHYNETGIILEQSNNNISLNTDDNGIIKTEGENETIIQTEQETDKKFFEDPKEGKKYDWMSSSDEVGNIELK